MSHSQLSGFILFSGYNPRAVLTLCRAFERLRVSYSIIARSDTDPIMSTSYSVKVNHIRNSNELEINNVLALIDRVKESEGYTDAILVPSTEGLNRFILRHREELLRHRIQVPLVDEALYQTISDKYSFGQLCETNGLAVPSTYEWNDEIDFPVVAKPIRYEDKGQPLNPVILENKDKLEAFKSSADIAKFYLQQYVSGDSYYLFYCFSRNGDVVSFSQQNLLQQGNGKSMVLAVPSSIHNEEIAQKYSSLLKNLGYLGVIMIEIKRSRTHDYMIEANPRFWGPLQLIEDCQVPIIDEWVRTWTGTDVADNDWPDKMLSGTYLWLGGLVSVWNDRSIMYHTDPAIVQQLNGYLECDVYARPDSYSYFLKELRGG